MKNQISKQMFLFWSLLLLVVCLLLPMEVFAVDYGKAMKSYQTNRNMGQEFMNFLIILGSMIAFGVVVAFLVKLLSRR